MSVPFCVNCRFVLAGHNPNPLEVYYCTHASVPMRPHDPVTGKTGYDYASLARMRQSECGPEGKLFEAKS